MRTTREELAMFRYVSHPEVHVDPATPVPEWHLSERGHARAKALLAQPWVPEVRRVVSSPERKALETATILATHLDLDVEVRDGTGEIDRSSTGFVPATRHEALADRCFARPDESADGWERAIDAQARLANALADLLERSNPVTTVAVGHGGVGTLLYCRLAGIPIGRQHDQPGQGHYWTFDDRAGALLHGWRPIDDLGEDRRGWSTGGQ